MGIKGKASTRQKNLQVSKPFGWTQSVGQGAAAFCVWLGRSSRGTHWKKLMEMITPSSASGPTENQPCCVWALKWYCSSGKLLSGAVSPCCMYFLKQSHYYATIVPNKTVLDTQIKWPHSRKLRPQKGSGSCPQSQAWRCYSSMPAEIPGWWLVIGGAIESCPEWGIHRKSCWHIIMHVLC